MHPRITPRVALAVMTIATACCMVPSVAEAQKQKRKVTMVETLPPSDGKPRTPFYSDAPDFEAAKRLAGCYDVTLGPWTDAQVRSDTIPVPTRVNLLTDVHTRLYIG